MITLHLFLPLKTPTKSIIASAQPILIPLSDCDFTENVVIKALDEIKINISPVLIVLHGKF